MDVPDVKLASNICSQAIYFCSVRCSGDQRHCRLSDVLNALASGCNPYETATELQNIAAFCSSHLCEPELHARASARSSACVKPAFLLRFGSELGITLRSVLKIDRTVDKYSRESTAKLSFVSSLVCSAILYFLVQFFP
jgi:hypothetical protein